MVRFSVYVKWKTKLDYYCCQNEKCMLFVKHSDDLNTEVLTVNHVNASSWLQYHWLLRDKENVMPICLPSKQHDWLHLSLITCHCEWKSRCCCDVSHAVCMKHHSLELVVVESIFIIIHCSLMHQECKLITQAKHNGCFFKGYVLGKNTKKQTRKK